MTIQPTLDSGSTLDPGSSASQPQPGSLSATKWLLCLLLAGGGSWVGFAKPPVTFEIPAELKDVDPNSSAAMKTKRETADVAAYWKNVLFQFSWAGLFMGSVGLSATILTGTKRYGVAIATLSIGIVSGILAGVCGTLLRKSLDKGPWLEFLSEDLRPLASDVAVLAVVSALLLVPVGSYIYLCGQKEARQKSVSAVLSGFISGMLTPVLVSMLTAFALVAPEYNTESFPLVGFPIITLWLSMLVLVGFGASAFTGTRIAKT